MSNWRLQSANLSRSRMAGENMNPNKRKVMNVIFFIISLILLLLICSMIFQVIKQILPLDFSQDYRKIPGIERIAFRDNWSETYFERCVWGLRERPTTAAEEKQEIEVAVLKEMGVLQEDVSAHQIREAILSPDGKYILYCEIEYNYTGSGLTDDEYCRYKVYHVDTGEVVTIYGAYKEWYDLFWCSE